MDSLSEICSSASNCRDCDLHFSRKRVVCGAGPSEARIMIIGEAPGSAEDEKGIPFVGRSGKLLDSVLKSVGMQRDQIYITNSVKCRPKLGKTPKRNEIKTCAGYLEMELSAVSPMLVVPMGNSALTSLGFILKRKFDRISEIVGKVIETDGFFIFPQFHPAAILRNPKRKEYFQEYFKMAKELLDDLGDLSRDEIISKYRVARP